MTTMMRAYTMTRRYLALDKGELALLQWKDIKSAKHTSLHKMCISRYLDSEDNIIYYSEKGPVEALRDISCPPSVYSCLMQWKNELKNKKGAQATESDMPIFPASEFFSGAPDTFLTHNQSMEIEEYIEKIIGLHDQQHIVRLRDRLNTKDVDLYNSRGDYFRNDFEIQALLFGLDPGAIDAILGRKSIYTYAKHYVDYRNIFIQEIIALTIERIIARDSLINISPSYSASTLPATDVLLPKGNHIVKQYIISVEDDLKIRVSVSNAYGTRVSVSVLGKEE